ncbi:hypothetical protein AGOR_G00201140 [Albula goreensis]|uniref:Disintegrin and metalloproteinase domain-containing protein 9-like n=1 Tax=Albula goreensis TaxID=1534307 RepID=A0A8T3CT53_9TELE|nr:hypothetical protein AGOR_G00201140 [Albula goreensis]
MCQVRPIACRGIKTSGAQASEFSNYKVVIPHIIHERWRRETNRTESEEVNSLQKLKPDRVTYSLSIENKDHFLHLKKNRDFLAKDFVQYSHDAHGNLVTSYPKVSEYCHYHGYVEGHEDSLVALSTCSGLRGVILFGNQSYGLEPAVGSPNNEHLLFPLTPSQPEDFTCGVTKDMSYSYDHTFHDPTLTISKLLRKKRNLPQPRYIELALVVDKMRFDFKKGNITAVREEMVDLANLLDGYYKQLNIHVILVGLEVFESENPFSVDESASTVLGNFVKWRRKFLIPRRRHDVGQLVVGRSSSYGGVLGMAFVGTVCSAASAGGINVFSDNNLQYFSTIVAHEMGHNLGMNHDDGRCTCEGGSCIMAASAGGSRKFSTCSEGEQCDCGTPEECKDKCCDAATCKLTRGSACAQGGCCKDCQIRVAGTPCRSSVNFCDLPEFCTGKSAFCPEDYYIMDGHPCANNSAYCFQGRCQTYDYQCQQLFGKTAKKAADVCFKEINSRGDKFGNCGGQAPNWVKCKLEDSMCGKVQCANVDANYPPQGATITVQDIGGARCVNADFGLGPDVLDPAYVNTGSGCRKGKTCLDFKCINASALEQDVDCDVQRTCNGNGVCNDQGHCHCDDGWAPPNCNRAGTGGSVDSGPTKIDYSLRNGLLIFFLLVVPILILIAILLLFLFRRDWMNKMLTNIRSSRTRNTTRSQSNGNAQTSTTPQPQMQNPPRSFESPSTYPQVISGLPPSYEELNYGNMEYGSSGEKVAPKQGPGVPKPIPPKQPPSFPPRP